MSRDKIIIDAPVIISCGDKCRLQSNIGYLDETYNIYYEYDKKYSDYICDETCDPFLLIMYATAIYIDAVIICKGPITKQLYYQITHYHMPLLAASIDAYHVVDISAELVSEVPSDNLTNTAALFSAGVDSFYTLLGRLGKDDDAYNPITHLVFNNLGALTKELDTANVLFEEKVRRIAAIADGFQLELVAVNSNILEITSDLPGAVSSPDFYKNAGAVYGLKRLFGTCYWSSAGGIAPGAFATLDDMAPFDFYNTSLISVRDLRFYLMDLTASRLDKVKAIADDSIVQKHLQTCHGDNDSKCFKCSRTLAELYALDRLDDYYDVFDIDWYKAHLNDRLGYTLGDKNEWYHGYCQEILEAAKDNGVSIPIGAWFMAIFKWRPTLFLKRTLKNSSFFRSIYERFDIRHKLNFE